MARNVIPGMKAGGGFMSLVIVVKHPADAASFAKTIFSVLGAIIDGLVSFFRALIG